jgi:hypothetical protein
MDDPLFMGGGQAARHLDRVVEGLWRWEGSSGKARPQSRAFEQLEHDEGRALLLAGVEDGHQVRMAEGAGGPRLQLEAAQALGVRAEAIEQDLDRDLTAEAGIAGAVDLAHASRAEGTENLVRSEACSRGQAQEDLQAPKGGETHEGYSRCRVPSTTFRPAVAAAPRVSLRGRQRAPWPPRIRLQEANAGKGGINWRVF